MLSRVTRDTFGTSDPMFRDPAVLARVQFVNVGPRISPVPEGRFASRQPARGEP